jgi:hypothetical protein
MLTESLSELDDLTASTSSVLRLLAGLLATLSHNKPGKNSLHCGLFFKCIYFS